VQNTKPIEVSLTPARRRISDRRICCRLGIAASLR
jgi:hypothetical protein